MSHPAPLTLRRPRPARALISLVAMIDVLLILLVFFMVTSTYLDLDMIPAVSQDREDAASGAPAQEAALPLLIRIGADGAPVVQGRTLGLDDLAALIEARVAESAALPVMLLPTGVARTQSLVSVMDVATRAGVTNLRVIRLEARP